MSLLFESSSWIVSSLVLVAISIALCLTILLIVRRIFSAEEMKKRHDVVGFTFSIIGVLYSVILGFTVINVQDRYNLVEQTIHTEAFMLADLYQDAAFFPQAGRDQIRSNLRDYIQYVVTEEWGHSLKDQDHLKTRAILKNIWDGYYQVDIKGEKMKIWYAESISKLNQFLNARLIRQFNAEQHLGGMMWSLLVVGALITICFMFFFGLESLRSHMLMTTLLAGYLSFMLFLVYSLDHVFKGPQGVRPTALVQVYSLFDEWDQNSPPSR